jgi:hypothetical protein
MTAQVIFLNTGHSPDEETRIRLEFYQEQFDLFQAEISFQSRDLSPNQKFIMKEKSHNKIRETWSLLTTSVETKDN